MAGGGDGYAEANDHETGERSVMNSLVHSPAPGSRRLEIYFCI